MDSLLLTRTKKISVLEIDFSKRGIRLKVLNLLPIEGRFMKANGIRTKLNANILTIACVNFRTVWGNKAKNLKKIKAFIRVAAKRGADMILFPETALTGYDVEPERKMHRINAETIPGPSTDKIATLTRKYNIYVIFGMPEKDKKNPYIIYNSVAIIGPAGIIGSYAKIHTPFDENQWCKKGERPFLIDTVWGLIGIGICYDAFMFPELPRYYAARGARLFLHPTALPNMTGWKDWYLNQIKARSLENMMFVATANLVGKEIINTFPGFSFIIGPRQENHLYKIFAGPASENNEEIIMATIDLSDSDKSRKRWPLFTPNNITGTPDWRPKQYMKMLKVIEKKTDLFKYE